AMNVLEEYSIDEVARLLGCTPRNVRRLLQDALDQLSRILLAGDLMEELPPATRGQKTCQEGKNYNFDVSDSKEGENKNNHVVDLGLPQSEKEYACLVWTGASLVISRRLWTTTKAWL